MKRTLAILSFVAVLTVAAFARPAFASKAMYCHNCCHDKCGQACCQDGCTDSCCQSK